MVKYYTLTYTCQVCGKRAQTTSTSRSEVRSQVGTCKVCHRSMCGRCNKFGVCIDHYSMIPLSERNIKEDYNKTAATKSRIYSWIMFAFFALGIAQLILNLKGQSDYAWGNHTPSTIGFWEVRPESLPIVIISVIIIIVLMVVEGRITRARNEEIQSWIIFHLNNGTFSGRATAPSQQMIQSNTFTFNNSPQNQPFNSAMFTNFSPIKPASSSQPVSNSQTMKPPSKPSESKEDNGWN